MFPLVEFSHFVAISSPIQKQPPEAILKNFAILAGKHIARNFFFNKVAGLRNVTLLVRNRCFQANFMKFLRTHFFIEHLWATASV